jgi:hypothetical protein
MPTDEVRVPLAAIHVSRTPCRVLRVCNWTIYRKFATTFPAMQYWLGVFPFGKALRELLQTICCYDLSILFEPPTPGSNVPSPDNVDGQPPIFDMAMGGSAAPGGASGFQPRAYQQATLRLNPSLRNPQSIENAGALLSSALAGESMLAPEKIVESFLVPAKARSEDALSPVEARNFPQFLALRQMMKPLASPVLSSILPGFVSAAFAEPEAAEAGPKAADDDVAALRRELHALRAQVEQQAAEVSHLKKAPKGRKG